MTTTTNLFKSSGSNFLQYGLIVTLQLCELFLQDLQPLLLVSNVHHGGRVFLRLQELLELGQLGLLLLVGDVQPLLNVELVALVLCRIGQGGVVEADDLVNSPTMRMIIQPDGSVKLLPGLFLADLQFLAGGFGHLFCEPFHHLQQVIKSFLTSQCQLLPRPWQNWAA